MRVRYKIRLIRYHYGCFDVIGHHADYKNYVMRYFISVKVDAQSPAVAHY
jgi:hypothetical protein